MKKILFSTSFASATTHGSYEDALNTALMVLTSKEGYTTDDGTPTDECETECKKSVYSGEYETSKVVTLDHHFVGLIVIFWLKPKLSESTKFIQTKVLCFVFSSMIEA